MLLSRAHRFIFLKTLKTAGTSVEILLEPLCAPPGHMPGPGARELVSPYGIIGFRGKESKYDLVTYRNHMSAAAVRDLHPEEFASYARIANVRDPYDKAVSTFHWATDMTPAEASRLAGEAPDELRRQFADRIVVRPDDDILRIDGQVVIDRVLRYEQLVADVERLNADLKLGLADIAGSMPRHKVSDRAIAGPPLAAYLGKRSIDAINARMDWYFDAFGYPRRDPDEAGLPD